MTSTEVSLRKQEERKKRRDTRHDDIESNGDVSAARKDAFSTETPTTALAMSPKHPAEHSLGHVRRQSLVENASKQKNVIKNASDGSPAITSAEVSLRKKDKRKRRGESRPSDIESNSDISYVPQDAFSNETSIAATVMPATCPAQHSMDIAMRQSQVENAANEKNVLENTSDGSPVMTRAEVCLRKKDRRKMSGERRLNVIESNDNLPGVPINIISTETMPPQHPAQYSAVPVTEQSLAKNEGKENHVLQDAIDGYLAMTNIDVNPRRKKRKRKKGRHDIETNNNLFGVPNKNFSPGISVLTLDMLSQHSGQYSVDSVMKQSQEENEEEVQNVIEKATEGSPAVTSEEVNPRKKNKKRRRRNTRCDTSEVPKHTFSLETCTPTFDMPLQSPAPYPTDLVMSQYQEANEGKEQNMVEKATGVSPAMTNVEMNTRKKTKVRKRKKIRHDTLQSPGPIVANSRHLEKEFAKLNTVRGDIADLSLVSKQDDLSKVSHFSLGRTNSSYLKKKLLVLDLNGLLADFVLGVPEGFKPDGKIRDKAVFKRPFCDDFLQFCSDKFHVGVWSSRKRQNVDAAIKLLVGASASKLLFTWNQSHCTKTKFQTIEDENKPLLLKELRKLWDKCRPGLPWNKGEFNESNTLLLDDSPYKALRNPMHTAIFPYSYRYSDTNDASLGPGGELRVYLEGLAMVDNVQEYVASHPFGQPAITESNPHWDFYRLVRGEDLVAKKGNTKRRHRLKCKKRKQKKKT